MTVPRSIHFIWWGNPCDQPSDQHPWEGKYEDAAFLGPNRIANHLYQDDLWQVKYWFDAAHEDCFEDKLNPRIIRRPIDDFDIPGKREGFHNRSHNSLRQSVMETLRDLSNYHAYSAMKDLFELYILYLEGGFYFDTTTFVPDPTPFFQALAAESDRTLPQFVLNAPGVPYKYFKNIGSVEKFISSPGGWPYQKDIKNKVVAVDYWAAAANKHDAFMQKASKRYVQRWKYISNPRNNVKITKFKSEDRLQKLVVGHLIDWAVKDTFIQMYGKNVARMNERCFQAFDLKDYNKVFFRTKIANGEDVFYDWHYDKKNNVADINFDAEYKFDVGLYGKLLADQNITDGQTYRQFILRIDNALREARAAEFKAASWVDKYQFFKQSGQTWDN